MFLIAKKPATDSGLPTAHAGFHANCRWPRAFQTNWTRPSGALHCSRRSAIGMPMWTDCSSCRHRPWPS